VRFLSQRPVLQLEQNQGKKPKRGSSLVCRRPTLLVRRIFGLWQFGHTMLLDSLRLRGKGTTLALSSARSTIGIRGFLVEENSKVTGWPGGIRFSAIAALLGFASHGQKLLTFHSVEFSREPESQ